MWKTLFGHCIYKSPQGTRIIQNPFFRWLEFDKSDAYQTVLNRRHPEKPGLEYIKQFTLAVEIQPAETCMLGLGGAGAAHALAPVLGSIPLTAVESNAEVIELAALFFMTEQLYNLQIFHQDASIFVHQEQKQFQHLLVDLYNTDAFPPHCANEDFIAHCKKRLLPNGILAVNLANRHEQWPVFQLIKTQFAHATLALPVKYCDNMIIFARNGDSILPFLDLLKEKKGLNRTSWDAQWGYVLNF